jgi:hypothetical protein
VSLDTIQPHTLRRLCGRPGVGDFSQAKLYISTSGRNVSLRPKSDAAPEFSGIEHHTVGNHIIHAPSVVDNLEWIATQDDEISAFSRFNRTHFLVESHHSRRDNRRGPTESR